MMIRRRLLHSALIALTAIGVARIVATYHVFSATFDEGAHIAAGMEWLERGTYTFDQEHPPLARLATALLPYAAGRRLHGTTNMWDGGSATLYGDGEYSRNLALARAGVLPFFVLAALVVFAWARRLFGDGPALVAVALFTTTPTILAHAGVATTDMAVTAGITASLYLLTRGAGRSSLSSAVLLGAAVGVAVASKLTSLLFIPVCAAAMLLGWWVVRRRATRDAPEIAPPFTLWPARTLVVASIVVALIAWAVYRFSFGVPATRHAHGIPVPAPELVNALQQIAQHNSGGHDAYLLGEYRRTGWWYFFLVALAVKTPIALLCLSIVGATASVRRASGDGDWQVVAPLAAAVAILLVVMPANINIGVRHILPIFPLLAIVSAAGVTALWRSTRHAYIARGAAIGLVAWQIVSSTAAHPDYLAYFNVAAGREPARVLLDSDLDWGQDLLRLADTVRARRIPALKIVYFGMADVTRHGMPNVTRLAPNERPMGWVAASQRALRHPGPRYAPYHWLNAYRPVAQAGPSILLFYVDRFPPSPTSTPTR